MSAHAALLDKWRKVLVFSIGADGSWSFSQLPDMRKFPPRFPIAPEANEELRRNDADGQQEAAGFLGGVLALAALKALRTDGVPCLPFTSEGGLSLISICESLHAVRLTHPYGEAIRDSCLMYLGAVLELAMMEPERLPVLHARLDAIDNAELHRLAMAAVQGQGSDDVVADLLETSAVAK